MGIPKFFRWLCERYPCLCETVKDFQLPEFDNFYLDMNGIIHICSHPNDKDPHFRISEEQIYVDIFHHLEVLFRLIRPKKLFFMAVDGVAPRAKMNQQRGRRFSSAKEAEVMEAKAREKGEVLPTEKRFDSNCITPGTEFMAKLHAQLKYFVAKKISTDRTWQKPTIILSGHDVPGEGEHKVMDYIRYLRSQDNWDPSTRHCLYGADADLIVLGLTTHEPNFSILREMVVYEKNSQKRTSSPESTNYCLLHLSLLRDYLDLEFGDLKDKISFEYNIESIIDDWILMGFLVGNDFVPHLPNLHIHQNALSMLYELYKQILPKLDGYINEGGRLNLKRLEEFMKDLSQFDLDHFDETYADLKYFESKTGRSMRKDFTTPLKEEEGTGTEKTKSNNSELQDLIKASNLEMYDFGDDNLDDCEPLEEEGDDTRNMDQCFPPNNGELHSDGEESENDSTFLREFRLHKQDYYLNKMHYEKVNSLKLREEAEGYVKALQWVLYYYYRGCPSWGWFYPHHYSPYTSDIKGFSDLNIQFEMGTPFQPFQQLLSVLPAASKEFLPKGFQTLMNDIDSPLADFYPKDFKIDLNGKRQDWEAVVLIPFIEEARLLDAMKPFYDDLTEEEKMRNTHGAMHVFNYSKEVSGVYEAPAYFLPIAKNHSVCMNISREEMTVPVEKLIIGPHPRGKHSGAGKYRAGFPTLKRIPFQHYLSKKGIKVFENPSRGDNMILEILKRSDLSSDPEKAMRAIAEKNCVIYVGWPHLLPAQVEMIVYSDCVVSCRANNRIVVEKGTEEERKSHERRLASLKTMHLTRMGIELGEVEGVVYAKPLEEYALAFQKNNKATLKMKFSPLTCSYPLNTVVLALEDESGESDISGERSMERGAISDSGDSPDAMTLEEYLPIGTTAFMLSPVYYGYPATIIGHLEGQLRINLVHTSEPNMWLVRDATSKAKKLYYPGFVAAGMVGMSSYLFSRITGSMLVQSAHTESDRINLGLSLKYFKTNKEAVGYTKKENGQWLYSDASINLVRQYMDKFPELFEYLSSNLNQSIFFKDQMFPGEEGVTKFAEIKAWLKTVISEHEWRSVGSEMIESEVIPVLETIMEGYQEKLLSKATLRLPPHLLCPGKAEVTPACPDPKADYRILDRVVYIRDCHDIKLGLKGVIIGIEKKENPLNENDDSFWIYDVYFDTEIVGGFAPCGSKSGRKCCYRLTKHVLINISFGVRTYGSQKPAAGGTSAVCESPIQQKQQPRKRLDYNLNNSIKMLMPSFENPAASQSIDSEMIAGVSPSASTSGSVTNFFNAYKNIKSDASPSAAPATSTSENAATSAAQNQQPQQQFFGFWNSLMSGKGSAGVDNKVPDLPDKSSYEPAINTVPQPNQIHENIETSSAAVVPPSAAAVSSVTAALPSPSPSANLLNMKPMSDALPAQVVQSAAPIQNNLQTEALKKMLRIHQQPEGSGNIAEVTDTRNIKGFFSAGGTGLSNQEAVANSGMPSSTNCGHDSCSFELVSHCQRNGLPLPQVTYQPTPNGQVVCYISLGDRMKVAGNPDVTNEKAFRNACCRSLNLLKTDNSCQDSASQPKNTPQTMNAPPLMDTPQTMNPPPLMNIPHPMNAPPLMNTPQPMNAPPMMNTPQPINVPPLMNTPQPMNPPKVLNSPKSMHVQTQKAAAPQQQEASQPFFANNRVESIENWRNIPSSDTGMNSTYRMKMNHLPGNVGVGGATSGSVPSNTLIFHSTAHQKQQMMSPLTAMPPPQVLGSLPSSRMAGPPQFAPFRQPKQIRIMSPPTAPPLPHQILNQPPTMPQQQTFFPQNKNNQNWQQKFVPPQVQRVASSNSTKSDSSGTSIDNQPQQQRSDHSPKHSHTDSEGNIKQTGGSSKSQKPTLNQSGGRQEDNVEPAYNVIEYQTRRPRRGGDDHSKKSGSEQASTKHSTSENQSPKKSPGEHTPSKRTAGRVRRPPRIAAKFHNPLA